MDAHNSQVLCDCIVEFFRLLNVCLVSYVIKTKITDSIFFFLNCYFLTLLPIFYETAYQNRQTLQDPIINFIVLL